MRAEAMDFVDIASIIIPGAVVAGVVLGLWGGGR
jgi:hypothetical protein